MAPGIVTIGGVASEPANGITLDRGAYKEQSQGPLDYDLKKELNGVGKHGKASYPHYLPTWELPEGGVYPPLKPFTHKEHGLDADPTFPNLLPPSQVQIEHLTPAIGSEVRGIQLSSLSDAGKDELALFVAQRGVVAFRDQDFADLPIEKALDFARYFGRQHIHPASGQPKGFPEVHLVHRGAETEFNGKGGGKAVGILETRTSSVAWHSDVAYEEQPPGTTFLYVLDLPKTDDGKYSGGDTAFVSQVETYRRLSEPFKARLEGLRALNSGHEQAAAARARDSVVRREPVANYHPVVRTHPATGQKALYVNQQFTRHIEGFKKEESDYLLKFLYDHIAYSIDAQCRVKWAPGTVVVWDNRVTAHTALLDWESGGRRHLARLTPQAEKPTE